MVLAKGRRLLFVLAEGVDVEGRGRAGVPLLLPLPVRRLLPSAAGVAEELPVRLDEPLAAAILAQKALLAGPR